MQNPDELSCRAALAVNCLTSLRDENADRPPYFSLDFHRQPATALRAIWDYGDGLGRYVDALARARAMSGSRQRENVDGILWRQLMDTLGPHGLSWIPDVPWLRPKDAPSCFPAADVAWAQRGALLGMMTRYRQTEDRQIARRIENLIDGMLAIGRGEKDVLFFPAKIYPFHGWRTGAHNASVADVVRAADPCWCGVVVHPAAAWYALQGYAPAAELVRRIVGTIRRHSDVFAPDGGFDAKSPGTTHFHSRTSIGLGALRLGLATDDEGLVDWAMGLYRAAAALGASSGFFPERTHTGRHCETCCVTDMLEMAVLLAQCRDSRYWADVERYGANRLLANQVLDADWLDRVPGRDPETPPPEPAFLRGDELLTTRIGGFLIAARPHDAVDEDQANYHVMGNCCHAAGARALHILWEHILEERPGETRVHLHLPRQTQRLSLFCPQKQGRRELRLAAKTPHRVRIRLPEFFVEGTLRMTRNEEPVSLPVREGYACWDPDRLDEVLCMSWNEPDRTTEYCASGERFRFHWKGNRVVSVDPPGLIQPLYRT